jgi:hypothetical protein
MNANHVESKFAMMGARLKVSVLPEQRVPEDYAVDIQRDRHGEYFEISVPEKLSQRLDVNVLQTDKSDRHLLLNGSLCQSVYGSGTVSTRNSFCATNRFDAARASPTSWSSSIVWQVNLFMFVPNTQTA